MDENLKGVLISKIKNSEEEIINLEIKRQNLEEELKSLNKINLLEKENYKLIENHNLFQEGIRNYIEKSNKLQTKKKDNEELIEKLKIENKNLQKYSNEKKDNNNKLIHSIKDLKESMNFCLINDNNFNEEIKENENEIKLEDLKPKYNGINSEELKFKKEEYEINYKELKEESNLFYEDIEEQKKIIETHKNYLNEINQQMNNFNEKLSISDLNIKIMNINKPNKKATKINQEINIFTDSIEQLSEIYLYGKKLFFDNIEKILKEINFNLNVINKNKYKNEYELDNVIKNLRNKIEEIQNLCFIFKDNKNIFNETNSIINEKVENLKDLYDKYVKENKKKKNIKKKEIKRKENIELNINSNINNYINNNDNILLKDSFLFEVENKKNKIELYKTKALFKKEEKEEIKKFFDEAKIIRKNWHEICYIYDDYDLHDIYYDIEAVGLDENHYFNVCYHSFQYNKKIEIQAFSINNESSSKYIKRNNNIEFEVKLYNLETSKIHIIYKESKNLKKMKKESIEFRKIYRDEIYGLDKLLEGQIAKFILILKGSFDIVNFDKYFLIRNEKNLNEVEYIWGGNVPKGGLKANILLSPKEAIWSFNISTKVSSEDNIENTIFKVPVEFVGGNNEVINIIPSSPQTSKIILDEKKRQYIIKYKNTKYKEVDFIIEGKFINKSKGEWVVDISDKQVDKFIPKDFILCKPQLNEIAKKIIEEFDLKHKDSDFKFKDYMKIGKWVNENIKYDLRYIEHTDFTAIDIYNKRRGVCHHFTKLSNALLYSLGYKVISVYGYSCENSIEFNENSAHSWSLIKLGDKWYPFDSTWGILSGKLPVSHIFGVFYDKIRETDGTDDVNINDEIISGRCLS